MGYREAVHFIAALGKGGQTLSEFSRQKTSVNLGNIFIWANSNQDLIWLINREIGGFRRAISRVGSNLAGRVGSVRAGKGLTRPDP